MFIWYRDSALTIVYLSDVPSLSLANSTWNTRGWTVQEFLAPRIILFYQADWTPYLDDRSCNHKQSDYIIDELKCSTGINARALVDFHPGTRDSREKLRWASNRKTTRRKTSPTLSHSGNVTALDWVGQSSNFNSCLPADISSYKGLSCTLPPLSEHDSQILVPTLRNDIVVVESASKLYTFLEKFSVPRFSDARLQLPCITFPLTEADGLRDVVITTEDKLVQFSPAMRTQQTFLLIHPWIRDLLELPDFADESQSVGNWPDELVTRQLRLLVRLSRRFGALLLARQRGGEYKRIASDNNIIAQVRDMAAINRIDVKILEIL
ncbi:uncharacterized protein BJ212DRAFT_1485242 [Suillus subaureus]|uniref:Heterokaryon incompatibility domain-containing protein n=1 Tax=Suillus subaureus TaxID=48587 RepID=A0A9P7E0Z2_9AGAM|nr:uncharacterized protein BJ212DRAFT_1485242 [Suillus subaureus]KAG1807960.1 hypothetical protein BJ212DRAFT_1485242 [Suillus subaureus]